MPRTTGFPCDPHERISVYRFNAVMVGIYARWAEQDAYDHNHKDSCHADPQDKPKSWHFHRIVSAANRPGTETSNVHAGSLRASVFWFMCSLLRGGPLFRLPGFLY